MNQILTKDQFEDVLFNPDLTVVQKEVNGRSEHITYVYVYEGDLAVYVVVRRINEKGTDYWKEAI